jgi:hypothetical protein
MDAEDDIHGIIHFTFGGIGGDYADSVNQKLVSDYGVTDECLGESAISSQKFFKSHWWVGLNGGDDDYLQCSEKPWQNGQLTTTAAPGSVDEDGNDAGGPSCTCKDEYFESEEKLTELMVAYFTFGSRSKCQPILDALSFEDKKAVMRMFCSRMAFDGDMAGSGKNQPSLSTDDTQSRFPIT